MSSDENKFNVAVVIGSGVRTESSVVAEAILINFLEVLRPLTGNLYAIAGHLSDGVGGMAHYIQVAGPGQRGGLACAFLRFVVAQVKICYHLVRLRREIDIVIFHFGTRPFALPVLVGRLVGLKVVSCATGRVSTRIAGLRYGHTLFGLGRLLAPAAFGLLEKINFALSHQIAVEVPSAVRFMGMQGYGDKIVITGAMYVDARLFRIDTPFTERDNLVGYVGRMTEGKGVMNLVDALPVLLETRGDLRFLLVGGGPLYGAISERLKSGPLAGRVTLAGWVPHDELPRLLNRMKLLVLPSFAEGLPGIVQEAMACGAVVVATPVGGVPDLVTDGQSGFVLADNSPGGIVKGITRALDCDNLEGIVAQARCIIEERYSYEAMVSQCQQALARLAEPRRAGA